jgi:hypothetical protein
MPEAGRQTAMNAMRSAAAEDLVAAMDTLRIVAEKAGEAMTLEEREYTMNAQLNLRLAVKSLRGTQEEAH